MVLDTILECICPILECTADPIKQHLSYAFKYHSKVGELNEAVQKLSDHRLTLQHSINDARSQAREIHGHVEQWMAQADQAIKHANDLISGAEQEANERYFFGMCPNLNGRYKLGKKADEERKEAISPLLDRKPDLEYISYQPRLRQIITPHPPEDLESRAEILKKVIAALENPEVNMVGLYGQGGVGKTYLAEQIHQQATLNNNLFEDVVMVPVSSTPELQNIQEQIAKFLGLKDFSVLQTNYERASRLRDRLEKRKVLLILDDLWKKLNLEDLGILFGTEEFRDCKILLTSRFQLIMREMEAQVTEGLQPLSDEESYLLLGKIVGADKLTMVGSTGEEIAKKCVGLPLLIDMNGKYLKDRALPAWEDKLNKLSSFSDDVLEEKIFKSIELHYNNLVSEEIKSLFLLCGLLGEFDISMFDLLKYSVGLGLFRRINTLKDARNRLETLTEDLKSSSLLMNHEKIGFVKIHDMVREAATRIASRDKGVYTMAKDEVWKEWPTKIPDAERCGWIYIPWRNIHKLPEKLEAPEVQLLALLNERGFPEAYLNVPDSLFDEVNAELKVVHFAGGDVPSTLPTSLRFLTNLHTLCLEYCHVQDVAIIGEMKGLQVLSLRRSDIVQLPKELAHLTQLKLLDLRGCNMLRVIPPKVLSSLSSLEELYMGFLDRVDWAVQGSNKEQSNASLAELECLCRLTTLELRVKDGRMLPERLHTEKLERYWIETEAQPFWSTFLKEFGDENPRILKLENLDTSIYGRDWLQILMRRATDLELMYMKLVTICQGPIISGAFSELRDLEVVGCHQLKHLFSISMVRSLSQLWKLKVWECKMIGEIVAIDEGEDGNTGNEAVEFTKLSSLTLHYLPQLKSFCSRLKKCVPLTAHMSSNTLPTVSENDGNTQLSFFDDMVALPSLEELEISWAGNFKMLWNNPVDTSSFGKLKKLLIWGSHKLLTVFPSNILERFQKLEELHIKYCDGIGEIVAVDEGEDGNRGNETVELTKLSSLTLVFLPQLKSFCSRLKKRVPQTAHMSSTNLPTVSENDDNTQLPLVDDMVALPSLEELEISFISNFKMLWNNPVDTSSFGKLKKLLIKNCCNLLTVFPSNILERFKKLEELHIESCDSIEVIYHLQESSVNKTNDSIAGFQLRILRMISLRKLVHIWSVDLPGTISLKNLRCLVFPQLTELVLDNLPELISFCTDHMLTIEWPQLKFLQATGCEKVIRCTLDQFNAQKSSGKAQSMIQIQHHLFLSEKGFANCERMVLDGRLIMGMMMFELPNLKSLELRSPIGWWARYPESSIWLHIQRLLPNLRELTLKIRQLRELMLYPQEGQGGGGGCLKALATHPIPNITVIYSGLIWIMNKTELEKLATNPYIERVEILSLEACLFLENVAPTLVSNFSSLTSLKITSCDRLISLVTISVATSLVQLKEMDIKNCRMLREILAFDDAAATNNAMQENIVFPKLKTLHCYNLPSLRGFYMGSHITLEFPSLKNVNIHDCPNMNVFACGTLKTPKLKGDLNSTIWESCLNYFRYIWTLKLDPSFPWLVEQWHCEQLPFQVFRRLETLVVDNCTCFLFAVPWNLLSSSTTLKSLSIERCDSLENVFDPEKLKNEDLRHVGSMALLEHLHLVDLPKLRNVWNKDPHGSLDIRNLQVLKVHNCGNLTELFTLSMALDLVHLRDLEVKQCTFLQVVIKKEEDEQVASNSTVFPSLESLYLEYLPSLTSLCSGSYVLNFKGLCKVALVESPNMRICAFTPTTEEGYPRDIVEGNEEDSRNYLCFLGCKVEVSNIQELKVEWNNLLAIWTANNQAEFLENLEVLELLHFPEGGLNSVSDLLQKFSKLKRLVLNSSFMKKIVLSSFNIKDENQGSSEHLKVLILTSLPCLNHLMVEESKPIRDFKYPDCLEVSNCNILRILVLPSVYFETLTTLEVSKCHGLINLIASSAARSMVHLKRMTVSECEMVTEIVASKEDGVTVSECEMVTEIVASEEDGAKAEICFRELEHLQLHCLPCLTSFCSGDLCFTFPSLKEVVVIECPKMNTFAPNILSAPLVRKVQITEYGVEWIWEGSLNSTIEGLYLEMNS